MKPSEQNILIDTLERALSAALQRNKVKIGGAYDTMRDEGGLPISIGIKLQGDATQVKSVINFSFPIDKFKESYKDTIELKQVTLDFGADNDEPAKKKKKKARPKKLGF